jgi:hypothetical protein
MKRCNGNLTDCTSVRRWTAPCILAVVAVWGCNPVTAPKEETAWPGEIVATLLCEGTEQLIGQDGEVLREGPTRTVLRIHDQGTAILDHSSPAILTIFACDANCTFSMGEVSITGMTSSTDMRTRFQISRLTGDYDGSISFSDLSNRSVERGHCEPTSLDTQF